MAFEIGEKAVYHPVEGKEKIVTILKRASDYDNGFMDEYNFKSRFDYLVEIDEKLEDNQIFLSRKPT